MSKTLIHSISIAEFDQKQGNTLTKRVPEFQFQQYSHNELANLVLPDGAHLHDEDWTYLVLNDVVLDGEKVVLYGMGFFRNVKDKNASRGAIQKAVLLLSSEPQFHLYEPILRTLLVRFMDNNDSKALKTAYDAVNKSFKKNMQVTIWDKEFQLDCHKYKEDEFGGLSLIQLVTMFKVDTMLIWYGLLMQRRLLFCGQPARLVGNACMVAPMLAAPLKGFTSYITPYVSLTNLDPILGRKTFVCGTTNSLFESKADWYDVLGSFSTGSVVNKDGVQVRGSDRELIKNVLAGIADGKTEAWVREQFRVYTTKFLQALDENTLKSQHRKYLADFRKTELYLWYRANVVAAALGSGDDAEQSAMECVELLQNEGESMVLLERARVWYQLTELLIDLHTIEEVCDHGGVPVIAAGLQESSAQVRKYSVLALSKLALSIKGQLAILSHQLLPRIIEMLDDPLPFVVNAASDCLLKISTLYIGVLTLVEHEVLPKLVSLACSERECTLRTRAAKTVLQINLFHPSPPGDAAAAFLHQYHTTHDANFRATVLELLDLWDQEIPQIEISAKMVNHLKALSADDDETRIQASTFLLQDLVAHRHLLLQFMQGNGLDFLMTNLQRRGASSKLTLLSWGLMAMVADSNIGSRALIKHSVLEQALRALHQSTDVLYLFYVARCVEVACQRRSTCRHFVDLQGPAQLMAFILPRTGHELEHSLCRPCLGAFKYVIRLVPEARSSVASYLEPLTTAVFYDDSGSSEDSSLKDTAVAVLRMVGLAKS